MGQSPAGFAATCDDFNPPIPCGMGHTTWLAVWLAMAISIHPSRVGWDCSWTQTSSKCSLFQSTHPVWDGTWPDRWYRHHRRISIHPSRVGWDALSCALASAAPLFQSTHPVWDGTRIASFLRILYNISIHPSRVGWDLLRVIADRIYY